MQENLLHGGLKFAHTQCFYDTNGDLETHRRPFSPLPPPPMKIVTFRMLLFFFCFFQETVLEKDVLLFLWSATTTINFLCVSKWTRVLWISFFFEKHHTFVARPKNAHRPFWALTCSKFAIHGATRPGSHEKTPREKKSGIFWQKNSGPHPSRPHPSGLHSTWTFEKETKTSSPPQKKKK